MMMRRLAFILCAGWLAISAHAIHGQPACTLNPIACENQLAGNPAAEWDINGAGDPTLQGFATEISVNKGDTVHLKVDTTASAFQIDIYRLGYYGGMGARKVATLAHLQGRDQPDCLANSSTGLIDCGNWFESASWTVPGTAVSGIYIARLSRPDTRGASHIVFVVRNDLDQSSLLFQTSDTSWQAHNTYGGNSLYTGSGTNPSGAYKVSYNRPFTTRGTSPESWLFNAEYPMVRWLEANGYDVSYFTGVDTDRYGATELFRHRVFLSVGHDEYWSGSQRANVEGARNAGVNLAFFSGHEAFWNTRWESSIDGSFTPYRTLVSDNETHANALTGTSFAVNCCTENAAITVSQTFASQPFWRNTRVATLAAGGSTALTAGTLGAEWDESPDDNFRLGGLVTLSSTTLGISQKLRDNGSTYGAGTATHALTLYRHASGALVFGAGTVQWSWGLDGHHDRGGSTPDAAMQQATVNLLSDMGVQPTSLQPGLVSGTAGTATPKMAITSSAASTSAASTGLAIDAVASGDRSGSQTSVTSNAFSTTATNELLLAFIAGDDASAGNTVTGVSGGGLIWQLVLRTNTQRGTSEIWRTFAANVLSGISVTATLSQGASASITVVSFTGVDTSGANGSGAIGATTSANAASGAPTASLTTTRDNSWVFGVGNDWDQAVARSVGSNQTIVHQYLASVGDTYWVQRATAPAPSSGSVVMINDTAPTSDRYNLTLCEILTASAAAAPPVITSATSASGTVGTAVSYQITATNAPTSYGAAGLPAGLSVNSGTGLISGTPTSAGTSTVTLSATNGAGSGNATLTLTIAAAPAPAITSATTASGTVGAAFSYQITATNAPTSYGAAGLPAGLSVNSGTGLISGTPSSAGTSTVTLSATNGGGTGSATLTLTVATNSGTPPVALVQKASSITTGAASINTAFPSGVTSGDLIAVGVSGWPNAGTITVTDSLANVYTRAASVQLTSGNSFTALFYAKNIKGGADTVTVAGAASGTQLSMVIAEFSGLDPVSPLDASAGASGSGNAPSSGNMTPTTAGDLVIGSNTHDATTVTTAGSGFSMIAIATEDGNTHQSLASEYALGASGSPQPAIFSLAATAPWAQVGAMFKAAGAQSNTYSISGSLTPAANGANATVNLSGTASATTIADVNGNYAFAGLVNGSYGVTPGKANFTFSPASQNVTINSANVSAVNFTAAANAAGILLVQKNFNGNESATANMSASFTSGNTPGNFLLVSASVARPARTLSIADSAGDTFAQAFGPINDPAQDVNLYVWYVQTARGGPNTVTITPPASSALEIHISEWSGMPANVVADQSGSATGIGTAVSSLAATTTANGELVFGYAWVANVASPGTGFTGLSLINGDLDEYQIQPTAGPVATTFTQSASGNWLAIMVTFKPGG
jgi:PKD repeat protein